MKTAPPIPSIETPSVRRVPMSYEAYLRYGEGTDNNVRTEWVDGEVIVYMPPKAEHQRIVEFLYTLLNLFVQFSDLGLVRVSPFEVKLWEGGPSREPDIFFLLSEQRSNLSPERLDGAPALAVEIISPSSLYIDRDKKFREYERAGVREYWIVDSRPHYQRADFYRLDETNRYELFGTETDETVNSGVVEGFWLRPGWVWQETPNPLTALAEIVGKDALIEALQADSSDDA